MQGATRRLMIKMALIFIGAAMVAFGLSALTMAIVQGATIGAVHPEYRALLGLGIGGMVLGVPCIGLGLYKLKEEVRGSTSAGRSAKNEE